MDIQDDKPKIKIKIKFVTIDFWSRPIFITEYGKYLSSLDKLYDACIMGRTDKEISDYFRKDDNIRLLTYHGADIDDDPMGTLLNYDRLEIVDEF